MIGEITGVLLAGGRSSRFGANKALAPWKGSTMVESVARIFNETFSRTILVTKSPEEYGRLSETLSIVRDLHSDHHALGAILTGLRAAKPGAIFVGACDMPFLTRELIESICASAAGSAAAVPVAEGVPQPLCGYYAPVCADAIQAGVDNGDFSIQAFLTKVGARLIDSRGLNGVLERSFADIDDQAAYRRLAAEA